MTDELADLLRNVAYVDPDPHRFRWEVRTDAESSRVEAWIAPTDDSRRDAYEAAGVLLDQILALGYAVTTVCEVGAITQGDGPWLGRVRVRLARDE